MSMPMRDDARPERVLEDPVTAVLPDPPVEVVVASDADLRAAVAGALQRCGCTFEELAEQARTGRFETVAARLAWVAIGDLGDLAG